MRRDPHVLRLAREGKVQRLAEHIDIPHPTREGHCGGGVYSCCRKLKAAMSKMGVWMGICYGNIVSISSFFPLGSPHTKIKRFCASELLFAIRPQKRTKISNANREKCIDSRKMHYISYKKATSLISTPRRARAHRAGPRPAQRQGQRHAEIADAPWPHGHAWPASGVARPARRDHRAAEARFREGERKPCP